MLRWPWRTPRDTKKEANDAAKCAEDSTNTARVELLRLREALLHDVASLKFENKERSSDR